MKIDKKEYKKNKRKKRKVVYLDLDYWDQKKKKRKLNLLRN
jgi:hypothetical protein